MNRADLALVVDTKQLERELARVRRSLRRTRRRSGTRDRLGAAAFQLFVAAVCVTAGWLIASYS